MGTKRVAGSLEFKVPKVVEKLSKFGPIEVTYRWQPSVQNANVNHQDTQLTRHILFFFSKISEEERRLIERVVKKFRV